MKVDLLAARFRRRVPSAKSCRWASERLPLETRLAQVRGTDVGPELAGPPSAGVRPPNFTEVLLVSEENEVLEGMKSSFFAATTGGAPAGGGSGGCGGWPGFRLETCPLGQGILPGVARRAVMEVAERELGVPTVERGVYLSEARRWREAFICNAVRGIVPVRMIVEENGSEEAVVLSVVRDFDGESPGRLTLALRDKLEDFMGMDEGRTLPL